MPDALPDADCLLIVPPLAHLTWPALGVHQLQACARAAGLRVAILYASVLYAERVGALTYADLCNAPTDWLLGERLFARAAWGAPPLGFSTVDLDAGLAARVDAEGRPTDRYLDHLTDASGEAAPPSAPRWTRALLLRCEQAALDLVEDLAPRIAARGYPVVGATTAFDQTSACLALLSRIQARAPETRTLLGGANCEGAMAEGIRSLPLGVDHVFSGESEHTFVALLRSVQGGAPPADPVVEGAPCRDLDALPTPSFADYWDQVGRVDLAGAPLWLSYETSRGCWWGARHHCTFCGLNGTGMTFRSKSPDRVLEELEALTAEAPTRRVCLTDNIMPHGYHQTLVPRLPERLPDLHLFYEQKANLTLAQVRALHAAGIRTIQPGIEALDTALLERMRKGVKARQNLALLRYAAAVGVTVKWNLLWGFPGDDPAAYARTLEVVRHIPHLFPPNALVFLSLDRFSPYFEDPATHGITDLEPLPVYGEVFPPGTDLHRIAYHFRGTYPCGSREDPPLLAALNQAVGAWRRAWEGDPEARPALQLRRAGPRYVLVDTRGLGGPPMVYLDEARAVAVAAGGPRRRVPAADWAIARGYALDLDGWCAPLAVAPPELLAALEAARPAPDGEALQAITTLG